MGVRIRERSGREYYTITWKKSGKRHERGLGFAPEWNRERAEEELKRCSSAGPAKIPRQAASRDSQRVVVNAPLVSSMTFSAAFELFYDHASTYKKTWRDDRHRYRLHLHDSIGHLRLDQIRVATIEKLKLELMAKKLSASSQVQVLALVRVVFNHVIRLELYEGTNPVSKYRPTEECVH